MWAAAEGHVQVIQALIDGGADINKFSAYRNLLSQTPISVRVVLSILGFLKVDYQRYTLLLVRVN